MKRIVALLVVLGVSGLMIGCGGKPTPAPVAPKADMGKAASSTTPPTDKPADKPEVKPDGEEMPAEPSDKTEATEPKDPAEPAEPAAPGDKKPETETEEKTE